MQRHVGLHGTINLNIKLIADLSPEFVSTRWPCLILSFCWKSIRWLWHPLPCLFSLLIKFTGHPLIGRSWLVCELCTIYMEEKWKQAHWMGSIEPLIQTLQWHLQWKWKNSWATQLIPPSPLTSYTTSLAKSSWTSSYHSFPDWLCHRKPHNFLIASEYTSPANLKWQLFSHIHIEPISITKIAITKLLNHLPKLIPF